MDGRRAAQESVFVTSWVDGGSSRCNGDKREINGRKWRVDGRPPWPAGAPSCHLNILQKPRRAAQLPPTGKETLCCTNGASFIQTRSVNIYPLASNQTHDIESRHTRRGSGRKIKRETADTGGV